MKLLNLLRSTFLKVLIVRRNRNTKNKLYFIKQFEDKLNQKAKETRNTSMLKRNLSSSGETQAANELNENFTPLLRSELRENKHSVVLMVRLKGTKRKVIVIQNIETLKQQIELSIGAIYALKGKELISITTSFYNFDKQSEGNKNSFFINHNTPTNNSKAEFTLNQFGLSKEKICFDIVYEFSKPFESTIQKIKAVTELENKLKKFNKDDSANGLLNYGAEIFAPDSDPEKIRTHKEQINKILESDVIHSGTL